MFSIQKYIHFNKASASAITVLENEEQGHAAVCRYDDENCSAFFIEQATLTRVSKGRKYMLMNGREYFLSAGDQVLVPANTVVFTCIPKQKDGFESLNTVLNEQAHPPAGATEKLKDKLLEHVYTSMSVPVLAQQCHMSTAAFKRHFAQTFGQPPKTWKRHICLQTALFNLKTGHHRVTDLCEALGFGTVSHFSYVFRQHFHMAPTAVARYK